VQPRDNYVRTERRFELLGDGHRRAEGDEPVGFLSVSRSRDDWDIGRQRPCRAHRQHRGVWIAQDQYDRTRALAAGGRERVGAGGIAEKDRLTLVAGGADGRVRSG
jgi:hypothetical protein